LGNKRKSKNVYRRLPSKRKPLGFRYVGFFLKSGFVLVLFIALSFLFIAGYNFISQWNYLNVKTIIVKGNSQLSKEQVIKHSKLCTGKNTLSLNLSAATKRLVFHSKIASAEIKRHFPSGITIHVKEHRPIAILDLGRTFAINYFGDIFIETYSSDAKQLPVVIGFGPSDIDSAGAIKGLPYNEVMKILHLGLQSDSVLSTNNIKRIRVDKQTGLTVYTLGRIKSIKLGYGNYHKKYERLKSIFAFLKERQDLENFISIDLRNPNRIVLKPSHI
jgi:cell division protein FtsQ